MHDSAEKAFKLFFIEGSFRAIRFFLRNQVRRKRNTGKSGSALRISVLVVRSSKFGKFKIYDKVFLEGAYHHYRFDFAIKVVFTLRYYKLSSANAK